MGCWGTGPFDSDTAADFSSEVRGGSDPEARMDILHFAMRCLVQADDLTLQRFEDYELESVVERAVAAVAFLADKVRGRDHWTNTSFARGCERTPPYKLLPPVELGEVEDVHWICAMAVLDKVEHLMQSDDSAAEYRKTLAELRADIRHRDATGQ